MAEVFYRPGNAFHTTIGTFGGIFWRMNFLPKANNNQFSHKHPIDHVTFLVRGRVRAEIENYPPMEWGAPAFIPIPAERTHRYIALEDKTLYFCIFNVPVGFIDKGTSLKELEQLLQFFCDDCPGCGEHVPERQ